jgi:hypothetical protein
MLTRQQGRQTLCASGANMLTILLMLAAGSATPVVIQQPAKAPKICREGEREVGTHMHSGRRCLTADEWQREDAAHGQMPVTARVTEGQNDGIVRPPPR